MRQIRTASHSSSARDDRPRRRGRSATARRPGRSRPRPRAAAADHCFPRSRAGRRDRAADATTSARSRWAAAKIARGACRSPGAASIIRVASPRSIFMHASRNLDSSSVAGGILNGPVVARAGRPAYSSPRQRPPGTASAAAANFGCVDVGVRAARRASAPTRANAQRRASDRDAQQEERAGTVAAHVEHRPVRIVPRALRPCRSVWRRPARATTARRR